MAKSLYHIITHLIKTLWVNCLSLMGKWISSKLTNSNFVPQSAAYLLSKILCPKDQPLKHWIPLSILYQLLDVLCEKQIKKQIRLEKMRVQSANDKVVALGILWYGVIMHKELEIPTSKKLLAERERERKDVIIWRLKEMMCRMFNDWELEGTHIIDKDFVNRSRKL